MKTTNATQARTAHAAALQCALAFAVALLVCLACAPGAALASQGALQAAHPGPAALQSQAGDGEYFSNDEFVIYLEDGLVGIVEYTGSAKKVSIPASVMLDGSTYPVVEVFPKAFAGTAVKSVSVPASVVSIDQGAFEKCRSLRKVAGCKGLEHIGEKAFFGCSKLASFPFGKKLELIEAKAFGKSKVKTSQYPGYLANDGSGNFRPRESVLRVRGDESYAEAYKVLSLVNGEREKEGLPALVMDKDLLEAAMQRAAEISVVFDHTRPDGTSCFTACPQKMYGENIAYGQSNAAQVMGSWMNSPGHRANILTADFKSIGIGCFEVNGTRYWVQAFGYDKADKAARPADRTATRTVVTAG